MSGAFALGMHALFLLLLIFGVTWQKKLEPQANIVDLYAGLSPPPRQLEPQPEPKPAPKIEPKPEPKPVIQPPKAAIKPAPKPEVAKPEIALKEKAEKERRQLEEKSKEVRKREEEAKTSAARQKQATDAEARRLQEQQDAHRKIAEQDAATRQSQIDKYKRAISDKIRRFIVLPPNMQGNPEAEFDVVLLQDGNPLGVKLKRTSGNPAYDNAVERAILRAQPLPLPPDPALFKDFRELNLKFRPQE